MALTATDRNNVAKAILLAIGLDAFKIAQLAKQLETALGTTGFTATLQAQLPGVVAQLDPGLSVAWFQAEIARYYATL